jgi:predicted DNA-binding WGR domain protein
VKPPPRVGSRLELELVDGTKNARRRYALTVARDPQLPLFAGEPARYVLVVAHGRLEGTPRVRRERFLDLDKLRARWRELEARRRRHGYVEVVSRRRHQAAHHLDRGAKVGQAVRLDDDHAARDEERGLDREARE